MALSDLAVFTEFTNTSLTETLAQQVELFNEASNGTIVLRSAAHVGDYSDSTFYKKIAGLVRRRNVYGSGSVTEKNLIQAIDSMVKVAAGTPPVRMDPAWFTWVQKNPEEAGAVVGQQLAVDALADMLNTSVMAAQAALIQVAALVYDGTADTPDTLTPGMLNNGQALMGDAYRRVLAWVLHSGSMFQLWGNNLANNEKLFTYGTVAVLGDPFGRRFVISDIPALFTAGSPNVYYDLGLTAGAVRCDQNNDFLDNVSTTNGDENIKRTYQAEWTFELGIKGFTWDKTNGGHSPTDSALSTSTNWDKTVTSIKDGPGVVIKHN